MNDRPLKTAPGRPRTWSAALFVCAVVLAFLLGAGLMIYARRPCQVVSVAIEPASFALAPGQTREVEATVRDSCGGVRFSKRIVAMGYDQVLRLMPEGARGL